jgi:hypothetical protein
MYDALLEFIKVSSSTIVISTLAILGLLNVLKLLLVEFADFTRWIRQSEAARELGLPRMIGRFLEYFGNTERTEERRK